VGTYGYLGPKGTFTEAALKKITSANDSLKPYANVTAALNSVREGNAHFALVPIENSVEGVVARTLDELATGEPLTIVAFSQDGAGFEKLMLHPPPVRSLKTVCE
jgi:prephenate dehydratase